MSTGKWTIETDDDLKKTFTSPVKATVLIKGDCSAKVAVNAGELAHILGDLDAVLDVGGHSKIVIAGNVQPGPVIHCDGITDIFVSGDLSGSLRSRGSLNLWINGDLIGQIGTGELATKMCTLGDVHGSIGPTAREAALLSLEVRGFMPSKILEETA